MRSLILFLTVAGLATAAPNILILIGDDIDRDTLGPWGGQAKTPHLDKMAAEGMRFDAVYANVAMCAPFRQEFYSGRCTWRTGSRPNHSRSKADTKSLPHYLRPLGYRVGLLGKSHVGPQSAYPFDRVGMLANKKVDNNPEALRLATKYATEARDAETPFCLVIAANDGHGPYTTGDPSHYDPKSFTLPADAIDTPAYRGTLAKHFAEVTNLDALLGDLRAMLAREKLADNTLVIYCSEQGNAFPFGMWTCFDDGLASGIVTTLPGVIPAGKSNKQLFWIADIAPTLLEAAGGTVDPKQFDGRSQWANFKGGDEKIHHYAYGAFTNCRIIDNRQRVFPIRSIRNRRYTLIWSPRGAEEVTSNVSLSQALDWVQGGERTGDPDTIGSWVLAADKDPALKPIVHRLHHRPVWALYDREKDPEELNNLAESPEKEAVFKRLQGDLKTWLERWGDGDPVATERGFVQQAKK